ncbi:MAG TPA: hypothetical protein VGG34_00305 [Opitutaceae bacterium]
MGSKNLLATIRTPIDPVTALAPIEEEAGFPKNRLNVGQCDIFGALLI